MKKLFKRLFCRKTKETNETINLLLDRLKREERAQNRYAILQQINILKTN